MDFVREALGLPAGELPAGRRFREMARRMGRLDARRDAGKEPDALRQRLTEKWRCRAPRRGKLRLGATPDAGLVRALNADTVVVAHGGTARALMVALGHETPQSAADLYIEQGTVYVFGDGSLGKYS